MQRQGARIFWFLGMVTLSVTALAQTGGPLKPAAPVAPVPNRTTAAVTPSALRQKGPIYTSFVKLPPPKNNYGKPSSVAGSIAIIDWLDGAAFGIPFGGSATLYGVFGASQAGRQVVFDIGGSAPRKGAPAVVARYLLTINSWEAKKIVFTVPTFAAMSLVGPQHQVRGTLSILSAPAPQTGFGAQGGTQYGTLLSSIPDVPVGFEAVDADADGHHSRDSGGDDCDDRDPNRYPGNTEVPDEAGHDEDCDPWTYGCIDADNDHYCDQVAFNMDGATRYQGDDCNDHNPSVHPNLNESCNGIDDNCDGRTDEGLIGCRTCTFNCSR